MFNESLHWKLRRVAAGYRQQDVASRAGISTTRYSAIERGEQEPSDLDRKLLERILPPLSFVDMRKRAEAGTVNA
jgi:transcriptional regulator with XRE-family HTH domain